MGLSTPKRWRIVSVPRAATRTPSAAIWPTAKARRPCARDILALYHRVDALVLCAGVSHTGLFCDMTDEQWRTVMDVNVSGMFYLIRALAPA